MKAKPDMTLGNNYIVMNKILKTNGWNKHINNNWKQKFEVGREVITDRMVVKKQALLGLMLLVLLVLVLKFFFRWILLQSVFDCNLILVRDREKTISSQGCQNPDFSLRSQTFCLTADFSTTFYICWKTMTFLHIPSQNHLQAP